MNVYACKGSAPLSMGGIPFRSFVTLKPPSTILEFCIRACCKALSSQSPHTETYFVYSTINCDCVSVLDTDILSNMFHLFIISD